MSRQKPLAALAAITAALAVAVPAASASAATPAPAVRTAPSLFGAGSLYCDVLYSEVAGAFASGNTLFENYLSNVFVYSRCGGAAI
jgi:hypothetical protein